MSTVEKAISLLNLFEEEPEWGLSDLARRSKFDKATTRRLLVALSNCGLIDQRLTWALDGLSDAIGRPVATPRLR